MPDALDYLENLKTAYDLYDGAKKIVDNTTKVYKLAQANPKDIAALEKAVGLISDKYKPLKKYFTATYKAADKAGKASFPVIADHTQKTKKELEAIEKREGMESPAFEKKLDRLISLLENQEHDLRERVAYMQIVMKKCDINIKNFTKMGKIISSTMRSLRVMAKIDPAGESKAVIRMLEIQRSGIEADPPRIVNAYKRLRKSALNHKAETQRQLIYAQSRLKAARDSKAKLLIADAKKFFSEVF